MRSTELLRVRVAFGALGAVPVFLAGWLGWVQVAQAGSLDRGEGVAPLPLVAATADRQAWKAHDVPAPRGSIVDRNGTTLAADSEVYAVRARAALPKACREDRALLEDWLGRVAGSLSLALVADPDMVDRASVREQARERILARLRRDLRVDELPKAGWPEGHPRVADVLVSGDVERLANIVALRQLHQCEQYPTLSLHFLPEFRRVYPARELTHGIVGHAETYRAKMPDGSVRRFRGGKDGLESFGVLLPRESGRRRYLKDGRTRPYFVAPAEEPPAGAVLHTTIDIELQRAATQLLTEQAESGTREDEDRKAKWGALVLVDLEDGDLMAAATWHRGLPPEKQAGAAFTPYQMRFEPGSIVKPLVLAYAHEVGALDWGAQFDCHPGGADYKQRIAGLGRAKPVRDDHDCGLLSPHGILVNSSNIGAAYVGLMLSRPQGQDYMAAYGFGRSLGLNLPNEALGGPNRNSFNADIPLRGFRANSAISFSFGYELETTALQVARAYLRMFRGLGSELRLVRGVEVDDEWTPVPPVQDPSPRLRPQVVDAIRAAMTDVVSNDPHATGYHMHRRMLRELGVDLHGLVGGKTGTAASSVGDGNGGLRSVRNASFVGFLPANEPRWLAVCVLQKDGRARFYGGSYAAPPAVKLLLRAQKLAERRRLRQESRGGSSGGQTRRDTRTGQAPDRVGLQAPGSSGWQSSVRAEEVREIR